MPAPRELTRIKRIGMIPAPRHARRDRLAPRAPAGLLVLACAHRRRGDRRRGDSRRDHAVRRRDAARRARDRIERCLESVKWADGRVYNDLFESDYEAVDTVVTYKNKEDLPKEG